MAISAIGPFSFISMRGSPDPIKMRGELIMRPGVDGVGAIRHGRRGTPFVVETMSDATSKQAARSLFRLYTELVFADVQPIGWSGIDLTGEQFGVLVLDVRPVEIGALAGSTPGLYPPSLGYVIAQWDLVAIELKPD